MNNDKLIDKILNKNHDKNIKLNHDNALNYIKNNFSNELDNYDHISTLEYFLNNCKNGGYIRYVNMKNELKWGGILLKIKNPEYDNLSEETYNNNENIVLVLKNKSNKIYEIDWRKNYIFYRKHKTSNDNLRELFISLIN